MTETTLAAAINALTIEIDRKSRCGQKARHAGNETLALAFYTQADDRIAARSALRNRLAMLEVA